MPGLLSEQLRLRTEPRFEADWKRQRRTAGDIVQRLLTQEGVILADQVGMGKTYVALAVAVTQILASPERGQVVIFVPASVGEKWVREWGKFSETLLEPGTGIRCVPKAIRRGEDFLKALDDVPEHRNHLVIVTHTALTATLQDPFVKLALLHYATRHLRDGVGAELRQRIAKWSAGRAGLFQHAQFTSVRVAKLLESPPAKWRDLWRRIADEELPDDPIPAALEAATRNLNLQAVRTAIGALPIRHSADIDRRLKKARGEISEATQAAWKSIIAATDLDLPLLIVDEAHRLKNSHTHISRLFAPRTGGAAAGAFAGIFRRMLFLTATPFELGHSELINVLSRMDAVRPLEPLPMEPLGSRLDVLGRLLTTAQASALTFDATWGRLVPEELGHFDAWTPDTSAPQEISTISREVWEHARLAVRARSQMYNALRPWVIRHAREPRRDYRPGRAIAESGTGAVGGLEIPERAALPFLLAARAQSVALDEAGSSRPLFAYGIASSYEAFGRLGSGTTEDGLDSDRAVEDKEQNDPSRREHVAGSAAVRWYRNEIDRAIRDDVVRDTHPKVQATVEKAVQLWLAGEKCLIFCWFIRTGIAVERALNNRIDHLVSEYAAAALQVSSGDTVRDALDRISERIFRRDGSSYERIRERLLKALTPAAGGYEDVLQLVVDSAIRQMRTHDHLVRYTPLSPSITDEEVWAGINGQNPGSIVLLDRWRLFAERLAKARNQIREEHDSEFTRISTALLGAHSEDDAAARRGASLRSVRRASGQTDRHDRERLIALFNTPFAPDLLVASSVMGEGIDLHQECRYVIHHDLDWNPSVLEQRTGRLDRIGALAEREGKPIEVYEPYLAGTHDEKMFRVVKDRAGWFDIVMGRSSNADESSTDAEEGRVPLHPNIVKALTMDLRSPSAANE